MNLEEYEKYFGITKDIAQQNVNNVVTEFNNLYMDMELSECNSL